MAKGLESATTVSPADRPCRHPAVSLRRQGGVPVLFQPDGGGERWLNDTGLWLWRRLDGRHTVAELATALHAEGGAPATDAAADLTVFLEGLTKAGMLAAANAGAHTLAPLPDQLPDARAVPRGLDIALTGACNLRCRYCFYADEMTARRDLPEAEWQRFFDELGRLTVRQVTLSGGEVFVRADLWALLDGVIRNRMRFALLSNGTLLTDDNVARLVERRRRLDYVQISIDGSCAETHDRSRGAGSFERAVAGLRRLREARLRANVRVTINRHNVDELEAIAAFLLDELGLPAFGCNEAMPLGAGCSNRDETALGPAEQVRAMRALVRLGERYPGRINATAGPLAKLGKFRDMERARATGWRPDTWRMGTLSACGCMFGKLAIHHDGAIAPCNMLGIELGRVNRDPLDQVWTTHPVLQEMRGRGRIGMREVPECHACEWAEVCNGSCPATAYTRTGSLVSANLDDCYRAFLTGIAARDRAELFAWRGEAGAP